MAKRRMLQWMRERLNRHVSDVVIPLAEKKVLDAAYKKALPLVLAVVTKKFPPAEMRMLKKWRCAEESSCARLQFPSGVVTEFSYNEDDRPLRPDNYEFRGQIYLIDERGAEAVDKWEKARDAFNAESKKRRTAYSALIDGCGYVDDLIDVWPEAATILPAGSPPIPLGPEQIALVKADQKERKAA